MKQAKKPKFNAAQCLIDALAGQAANMKRARIRHDAKSIAEYQFMIDATLSALETLGYNRLDCLEMVSAD